MTETWSEWYGGSEDVYRAPVKAGDTIELRIPGLDVLRRTVFTGTDEDIPKVETFNGQAVCFRDYSNGLHPSHTWKFRVLQPEPSLPTEPGLYALSDSDDFITGLNRLILTNKGDWYWLDFTGSYIDNVIQDPVGDISEYAKHMRKVYP